MNAAPRLHSGQASRRRSGQAVGQVYAMVAVAFVGFAIWGSLFPFDIQWVPLGAAVRRFWHACHSSSSTASVTDICSNFLLFVPVGLFAAAALDHRWPGRSTVHAVLTGGFLVSAAVEFGQAFMWSRTPSIVDVVAEGMGTAAGIGLWRVAQADIERAVGTTTELWRRATAAEQLLWVYCAAFVGAWLFPFDFTLRANEISHKYEHKRLLLPFTPSPDAATPAHLQLVCIAAVPLGLAAALCARRGAGRPFARACALAAFGLLLLEAMQVTVLSRTTDATLVVAALPGAAVGVAVTMLLRRRRS